MRLTLVAALAASASAAPASAYAVDYLTAEQAARLIFPDADHFESREIDPRCGAAASARRAGRRGRSARWPVRVAQRARAARLCRRRRGGRQVRADLVRRRHRSRRRGATDRDPLVPREPRRRSAAAGLAPPVRRQDGGRAAARRRRHRQHQRRDAQLHACHRRRATHRRRCRAARHKGRSLRLREAARPRAPFAPTLSGGNRRARAVPGCAGRGRCSARWSRSASRQSSDAAATRRSAAAFARIAAAAGEPVALRAGERHRSLQRGRPGRRIDDRRRCPGPCSRPRAPCRRQRRRIRHLARQRRRAAWRCVGATCTSARRTFDSTSAASPRATPSIARVEPSSHAGVEAGWVNAGGDLRAFGAADGADRSARRDRRRRSPLRDARGRRLRDQLPRRCASATSAMPASPRRTASGPTR